MWANADVRLGLAQPRRQPLQQAVDAFVLLSAEHGRLGEGPLQPGVARLAAADADAFAGRLLHGAAQPGVGTELLARVEALDDVDLQEDGQRQDGPDAGRRLQDGQLGRVVFLGGLFDLGFEASDGGVERIEQGQVGLDAAADEGVGDVGDDVGAFALVLDVAGDRRQVGLSSGGVDVAVEFGALADESESGAEEVAQSASLLGVGVGEGEVASAEQSGDGLGVVAVALGFAAVDGFHGPGVSEDEGEVVVAAGVGEPVPAVHALAADDESVAEGLDGVEEGFGRGGEVAAEAGLSVAVEDDEEEGPGVQIDAGVESDVGGRLEATHVKASG